jgi:hypothetical protein
MSVENTPMAGPGPADSPRGGSGFAPNGDDSYAVFVLGASGDLAHKKTYPSLYELYVKGLLPTSTVVVGYARSAMSDDAFRATIRGKLKGGSDEQRAAFVNMCIYRNGSGYDDKEAFAKASLARFGRQSRLARVGLARRGGMRACVARRWSIPRTLGSVAAVSACGARCRRCVAAHHDLTLRLYLRLARAVPLPPLPPTQISAEVDNMEDELRGAGVCGRVFYFAIPPSVFVTAAEMVHASGLVRGASEG